MRLPAPSYPLLACVETHLPHLRPAQQRSLALWVTGTLLAGRCSQSAVLTALEPVLPGTARNTLREYLREGLRDGAEKAAPCQISLDVTTCFAPLLRWILAYWHGDHLALALDATTRGERVVVLCLSVLYRGSAIPIAWQVVPANQRGAWLPHLLSLLSQVAAVIPATMTVLVLTDRGLWSPALWQHIRVLGWHPLQRLRPDVTFCPSGGRRGLARTLVAGPGQAWVGTGVAFKHAHVKRSGTLVVCWAAGEAEPWICLTDLAPAAVGVAWYGLRTWIELGFRFLKRGGWDWQHTRRTDPHRSASAGRGAGHAHHRPGRDAGRGRGRARPTAPRHPRRHATAGSAQPAGQCPRARPGHRARPAVAGSPAVALVVALARAAGRPPPHDPARQPAPCSRITCLPTPLSRCAGEGSRVANPNCLWRLQSVRVMAGGLQPFSETLAR